MDALAKNEDAAAVEAQEEKKQPTLNPYEEKLKKNYEDFMAIVEKESKKDIPFP